MTLPLTGAGPSASAGIANWWDPNNVGLSCVGAYRAKGAASYAASLVNNVTPGTYDLVEGNGAVPWAAATGWGFVAASLQYFDTGLIPANDQSWSALVQYANVPAGIDGFLLGERSGASAEFNLRPNRALNSVRYQNGQDTVVVISLLTGNIGMAGNQGYRNGVPDGGLMGIWLGASDRSIYIGGNNRLGVLELPITADIHAVSIYDAAPAVVQGQAAAIATATAAL